MGAIAEALGALGVICTLIYLAVQIRQNSRATLIAGHHGIASQWHACSQLMIGTPELASIVLRGNRSMSELTPEETLRFGAYMQTFFDITESYHRFIGQLGLKDEEEVLEKVVARRIVTPGMAQWWDANAADYSPDFVTWVEGVRKAAASAAAA
jgi:hypothetical protein